MGFIKKIFINAPTNLYNDLFKFDFGRIFMTFPFPTFGIWSKKFLNGAQASFWTGLIGCAILWKYPTPLKTPTYYNEKKKSTQMKMKMQMPFTKSYVRK